MQQQDLVSLYEKILASLNVSHADGYLLYGHGDAADPLLCEDRRVVLPTREILETMDRKACIAFHPLCESTVRGESSIIRKLRALVNTHLGYALSELLNNLLGIAMDTARHAALSPDQKEFITLIPDIPSDCHSQMMAMLKITGGASENRVANVYIKRAPTLDGVGYKRGAIITFPLIAELERADDKVFGKTIKKKNKAVLLKLLRYILDETPELTAAERYSCGSNSAIAPNFHCLMLTYVKTMRRFNSLIWEYRSRITNYKDIHVKLDWINDLKDLSIYKGLLPVLAGNDGEVVTGAPAESVEPNKPSQPIVARHASIAAPAAHPANATPPLPKPTLPPQAAAPASIVTPNAGVVDEVASWTGYVVGNRQAAVTTLPLVGRGMQTPAPAYPPAAQYPQYPQAYQPAVPTVTYPLTNGQQVTIAAPTNASAPHQPAYQQPAYQPPQRGGYASPTGSRFGI